MQRPTGRWGRVRNLLVSVTVAVATIGAPASISRAAAPPPPLDACLDHGAFNIADPACDAHSPVSGSQFGPIDRVVTHAVQPGGLATLSFTPVGEFFTDRVVSCGDAGCIGHGVGWRPTDRMLYEFISPCSNTDISCTVRYWPGIGDGGERWGVIYSVHGLGITPLGGTAHALYAPPRFYPVRADAVDATGAPGRSPPTGSLTPCGRARRLPPRVARHRTGSSH